MGNVQAKHWTVPMKGPVHSRQEEEMRDCCAEWLQCPRAFFHIAENYV